MTPRRISTQVLIKFFAFHEKISFLKVTTDSYATFYPKNRFSLNSVNLFSISILIFKNNKKLNSSVLEV